MRSVARYPRVLVLAVTAASAGQPQQRERNVFLTVADTMASPFVPEHVRHHKTTGETTAAGGPTAPTGPIPGTSMNVTQASSVPPPLSSGEHGGMPIMLALAG